MAEPRTQHRRLPAEWEPHAGIQLTWPHDASDWADTLDVVEPVFARLAALISQYQPVLIVARDPDHIESFSGLLVEAGIRSDRLWFALAPSDDTWARDHGPITVLEPDGPRLLDFTFNGWGGKYAADSDNAITRALAAQGVFGAAPVESVPMVLEGGSIESDGAGTLLVTRSCLLHPGRNPDLDANAIEAEFRRHLGAERVLWLEHGRLEGDDTDGHIDTLARFCGPDTIAYQQCDDPADPHYAELAAMERELAALRQPSGEPYHLVPLPWPRPLLDGEQRLPATYANFVILNGAVILPAHGDAADDIARERLAGAFPGRDIVTLDARPVLRQGGSLHCLTMQYPRGALGIPEEEDPLHA
ncbi:agmatine/peptidylarginine deiminase [Thioalkalivibrio sp. ALJ24]|uniref:agmatine deiminase family protein n=1 Tax=Thioalkalivibrio sp. ALJ24 TaxID=545276 RepID=UPI000368B6E8|nr:agmatine deiminase family protein [Thioalkalivibrio sp. ALJ24]